LFGVPLDYGSVNYGVFRELCLYSQDLSSLFDVIALNAAVD